MKRSRILATLVAVALSLSACSGSIDASSASASKAAERTLGEWVQEVGLMDVMTGISTSVNALAGDLDAVPSGDLQALAAAIGKNGPALAAQAKDLAAEATNTDVAYENLRAATVDALNAFAKKAEEATKAKKADLAAAVGSATKSLNDLTAALAALTDYITAHKSDPVSAAS